MAIYGGALERLCMCDGVFAAIGQKLSFAVQWPRVGA
jgi:hypothetical protein